MNKELECKRCGREFKRLYNLHRHINRKRPCISKSTQKVSKKVPEISKRVQISPTNLQISPNRISTINHESITENENSKKNITLKRCKSTDAIFVENQETKKEEYNCQYCNKNFKHKQNVSRHINYLRCEAIPLIIKNNIVSTKKN